MPSRRPPAFSTCHPRLLSLAAALAVAGVSATCIFADHHKEGETAGEATSEATAVAGDSAWLEIEATAEGPGSGKHLVWISAEEEYRTEESFPMLAKILAEQGFRSTILFAVNRENGTIDPDQLDNIPGLEKLAEADLAILALRWRHLPDEQMRHFVDFTASGTPLISIRVNTHPFNYPDDSTSPYAKYDWELGETGGGWGREVVGETWVRHYGKHAVEGTRAVPAYGKSSHPLLRGVSDVWGPSDVYGLELDVAEDIDPVLMGLITESLDPDSPVRADREATPVAWTRTYDDGDGTPTNMVVTTMGSGDDFLNPGLRRFVCNAVYHLLEMDVPEEMNVTPVDPYEARKFGFGGHKVGVKPSEAGTSAQAEAEPKKPDFARY